MPITHFTSSSIRNGVKTQTPWESNQVKHSVTQMSGTVIIPEQSQDPSASSSPEQSQAEHALPRPTLLAPVIPVILASHAAEAMGERPVPHACAGVHTQPHAPLHGQLSPEVLPLLQPRAGRFALCLWIPTDWRVWLEQSQPRDFC